MTIIGVLCPEDQLTEDTPEIESKAGSLGGDHPSPAAAILDTIRALPDSYRETLVLRLVEGMTGPEIAARTGLKHGSVRVDLHRGMQRPRETLAEFKRPSAGTGDAVIMHTGSHRMENEQGARRDDYLWDRSGGPDPEVQRLETILRIGKEEHGEAAR